MGHWHLRLVADILSCVEATCLVSLAHYILELIPSLDDVRELLTQFLSPRGTFHTVFYRFPLEVLGNLYRIHFSLLSLTWPAFRAHATCRGLWLLLPIVIVYDVLNELCYNDIALVFRCRLLGISCVPHVQRLLLLWMITHSLHTFLYLLLR